LEIPKTINIKVIADLHQILVTPPEMDGITVFQHLQQNLITQNIPVILLTAKVQASDRARFAQLDIAGTIAKPFEPLQIADQIAQLLKW
jgi:CheY-like chemotaxis protein